MENTLRAHSKQCQRRTKMVLILVLMEDTLRDGQLPISRAACGGVLILVLMENTLRAAIINEYNKVRWS